MQMKGYHYLYFSILLIWCLASCGTESNPEQPEPTRAEYLWLNETVTLPPGIQTSFSRDFIGEDTLLVTVSLLNPYPLSFISLMNSQDSTIFSLEDVESGNFYIHIPASDSHSLIMQQSGELARFQLYAKIIRWEYRP